MNRPFLFYWRSERNIDAVIETRRLRLCLEPLSPSKTRIFVCLRETGNQQCRLIAHIRHLTSHSLQIYIFYRATTTLAPSSVNDCPTHISLLMAETKIIYHIDEEETPYLVKLTVSPEKVTLADFKNVLNNRPVNSYKFFFKSMDQDFG